MRGLFALILCSVLLSYSTAFGQKQLKGKVRDISGKGISSVNVTLKDIKGNIISFNRSDSKGDFLISIKNENIVNYSLEASSVGYKKTSVKIDDITKSYDLILQSGEINLETVTVKNRPKLTSNGDTLSYRPSDFADKQDSFHNNLILYSI